MTDDTAAITELLHKYYDALAWRTETGSGFGAMNDGFRCGS